MNEKRESVLVVCGNVCDGSRRLASYVARDTSKFNTLGIIFQADF